MQLYHNPASPFCRKVDVVLHETGQFDAVEAVPAKGNVVDPGTQPIGINPLGKIPTLTRDDGPAIFDSRVICRYLDAKGGGSLYPETRIWEVLTLEAMADGMLDAALGMVYEGRLRDEAHQNQAVVEGYWAKIARGLDALEDRWLSHLGGPVSAGQIAVGCMLGYLDFRLGDRNWRDGRPELAKWSENFGARASMQATMPSD